MKLSKLIPALACAIATFTAVSYGDTFGSVTVTNGISAGTNIQAGGYIQAAGNVVSAGGNIISSAGNVRAATYLQASQNLAVGGSNLTSGVLNSGAIGEAATASSYSSFVVGRYNVLEGTAGSWNSTVGAKEPLFVVGNGTSTATADRRNAFAVYKDGTITMSQAQGDILMGQFGN